ncbi:uncharacterized protein RCC_04267 [Ramularia collo-cygni]|uniref:Myb-like domain-containing protein n=1 Tax=Ramularia collo-cygni TaxID=112498 RepID=A0A2D3UPI1_9PEZI|nr:uncharacterized protein RCC_04267 [Ramularia collo-cygni]CZT18422.1 uncharacterized protein RCC_04267 [Ramularia collo-cygni]
MLLIKRSFKVINKLPNRTLFHPCRSFTTSRPLWTPAKQDTTAKKGASKSRSRPYHRWSPEEEALLLKLREERLGWTAVQARLPTTRSIAGLIDKYGSIAPRGDQGRFLHTPRYTDAERALITKLRNEGLSWQEIQKRHFPTHSARNLACTYSSTRTARGNDVFVYRLWSKEDVEKLLLLREERKMGYPEIAVAMGRTNASVKTKYRDLSKAREMRLGSQGRGYVRVKSRLHWPDEDEARLVEMITQGATNKEICATWPRRKPIGIGRKILEIKKRIGLSEPPKVNPVDKKSLAKMTKLKAQGATWKEIADMMSEFTLAELQYAYQRDVARRRKADAEENVAKASKNGE